MNEVTQILHAVAQGDQQAANRLLPLVYEELRRLAAQKLSHETPGQTLDATALVHEAYLRLVPGGGDVASAGRQGQPCDGDQLWDGRAHFFAAAAEAMRRILIDNARRKRRPKHGGGRRRVDLDQVCTMAQTRPDDLLALDEAFTKFAAEEPAKAELVKLRYFAGFSIDEAADTLGISRATAKRYWAYARAWLFCELTK
jgi:RNA polymerase sigma factor (sigma-70 family)